MNVINITTTVGEWNLSGNGNGCSLREAITAANENEPFGGCTTGSDSVRDYINVPQGTYKIESAGTDGDIMDISVGDFDVKQDVTIKGAGRTLTIIDAQSKDHIFDLALSTRVQLDSMTLKNGKVASDVGGAIRARGYQADLIYLIVQNNKSGDAAFFFIPLFIRLIGITCGRGFWLNGSITR